MGVRAASSTSILLPVGGSWLLDVDTDGDVPSVVVTPPAGDPVAAVVEQISAGCYRAVYVPAVAGRYIARASTADGVVDFAAYATAVTSGAGMPDVPAVVGYVGPTSHTEEELQEALDAEAAAQRGVCRIAAVYPADLREALLRRVARNLALRALPLAVLQGDAEAGGSTVLPGRDPEVRRLEAPHRKLPIG